MKSDEILIKTFDQVKNDNFDQVKFDQVIVCLYLYLPISKLLLSYNLRTYLVTKNFVYPMLSFQVVALI
jgi:hypothetical protein